MSYSIYKSTIVLPNLNSLKKTTTIRKDLNLLDKKFDNYNNYTDFNLKSNDIKVRKYNKT